MPYGTHTNAELIPTAPARMPGFSVRRTGPYAGPRNGIGARPPQLSLARSIASKGLARIPDAPADVLGRISSGGGHPATGRACGNRNRRAGAGYAYFHHTVDDHSRLGYSENLTDDKKETAAAFWLRANAFFSAHGISVEAALTANGSCYSSRAFAVALTLGIKHRRTALPFRAQTNGKVERFNRTPLRKGPMPSRTPQRWNAPAPTTLGLHDNNHHRTHVGSEAKLPSAAFTISMEGTPRALPKSTGFPSEVPRTQRWSC